MYKHILLPTDGSDLSERAIAAGIDLAKALNARVSGLFVGEATYIPGVNETTNPRTEAALSVITQRAKEAGLISVSAYALGDTPQAAIIQFAKENACDLIIMGTHGRSKVGKLFLGSVAASVLAESDVPVLLYR